MTTADPLAEWLEASVPRVDPGEWSMSSPMAGLREIARLRRALDAAQALLVPLVRATVGRDTKALMQNDLLMTAGEAVRAQQVADVVERVEGAAEALGDGEISSEHVRALRNVADTREASELLARAVASRPSPEEFQRIVDKFRLDQDPSDWKGRQAKLRSLRFFSADHGMVGMRAILPSLDGAQVKAALQQMVADKYRADHPDGAPSHEVRDSNDQLLADALVASVLGVAPSHCVETTASAGSAGRTAVVVVVSEEAVASHAGNGPWGAEIVGSGSIPFTDVAKLAARAADRRSSVDIYSAVAAAGGSVIKFGRNRRLASALQRLALAVRDRGCVVAGCTATWEFCDADHVVEWESGGKTDLENLRLLCSKHDSHRHEPGTRLRVSSNSHVKRNSQEDPPGGEQRAEVLKTRDANGPPAAA